MLLKVSTTLSLTQDKSFKLLFIDSDNSYKLLLNAIEYFGAYKKFIKILINVTFLQSLFSYEVDNQET
ncbi:hypothetical protein HERIO_157 [Hepatospora eriocheir]|uniref:Uncharacterized protein n=1 Tax=Hepatospora eriocheir TaxID=1081669 RepID=A0A1X0QDX6_9MICR|nr:hypothetical protein HERIO_157 [Hepatospora eriocheir]